MLEIQSCSMEMACLEGFPELTTDFSWTRNKSSLCQTTENWDVLS